LSLERLPIDEFIPEIIAGLRSAGAIVLKAEPGAGKTTRVPPAMLEAGLAVVDDQRPGKIIVLQPRRVAARAAASRVAGERGQAIGDEVGYQVRFEKRVSGETRILFCTEGIFLRRLQDDPLLSDVAAVVFDEFHERSADSDLALAMVRQIQQSVRPDLHIVVMSATLEAAPLVAYLGGCPSVECPGRTFPIEIEFLPSPSSDSLEQLIADGVKRMLERTNGHLLVFLPGFAEIRQIYSVLESDPSTTAYSIMKLYGDMPLEEQQAVLLPSRQRKIVLATNVAETSVTISGVTAVVDSGFFRVNRLDPRLGINRLELSRISKASADQRAGRAGRTAAGSCLRLWTEREHGLLLDYEVPEVARVELSQLLLQLIAWGEHDVRAFPWFEAPPHAAIEQALLLLERLDALAGGKLTEAGKRMASLPVQPRAARLLLEGERLGQPRRAALCAALLEERDPFRRTGVKTTASHNSDSDVLDRLEVIEAFEANGQRHSAERELLPGAAKQILRAGKDLGRLILDDRDKKFQDSYNDRAGHDAILRSILAAYPDRVCKRREPAGRRAIMVGGRGVRLADESAVGACELFLAVELIESGQSESLVRQASRVEKDWLPKKHLNESLEVDYDVAREKVMALRRWRFFDLIIDEQAAPLPPGTDAAAILAKAAAEHFDLAVLASEESKRYMSRLNWLRDCQPELELPDFGPSPWAALLPEWCLGCSSIAELRAAPLVSIMQSHLSQKQIAAVDEYAPDSIVVPSGRRIRLDYEPGKPPVLAARIQEMFGLPETPRVANSKIPVLLHLLAPNNRVQQITSDLANFWKVTYAQIKKDLKSRYPKHAWPDDPLKAQPEARPRRRSDA
jgi:ATP-dependent helicase HrpB